jgi:AcrR family transcriptional regulator
MNHNLKDRRARRSQRVLREALFSLILEKGYDAVTIEDITGRADLGRTTFYLHYKDKEDLLLQCIQETVGELVEEISKMMPSDNRSSDKNVPDPIYFIFEHAAQNADLYRIILRGEGSFRTSARLRVIISQYASELLTQTKSEIHITETVPMDVISNYFTGSLLGMLTWWLESNMRYSAQEISEMYRRLLITGLRDLHTSE